MEKLNKIKPYLPAAATFVLAIVTCIIYSTCGYETELIRYFELFGCALVPLAFPLFGLIFKKPLPFALNVVVSAHVVLACFLGSILDLYGKWWWYDLFMHGAFGFTGSVVGYVIYRRWCGEPKFGLVILFTICFTMACAAGWEIIEYVCSFIPGNDPQGTAGLVGKDAIKDTMQDIIITLAGIALFVFCAVLDFALKKDVFEKLFVVKADESTDKENKQTEINDKE